MRDLLSGKMMLAKTMRMVLQHEQAIRDTPEAGAPYEITVRFSFPSQALTMDITDFAEAYLEQALGDALQEARPPREETPLPRDTDMTARLEWPDAHISGRLIRHFDVNEDAHPTRIDIRVSQ